MLALPACGFGFEEFRFGGIGPAAEIEGDGHASITQFVGESTVHEGAGHNHTSDAQGGDTLRGAATRAAVVEQAAFEDADHGPEDGFEREPCGFAAARDVGGQSDHGAGILDVFKVLARKVSADDLRPYVGG